MDEVSRHERVIYELRDARAEINRLVQRVRELEAENLSLRVSNRTAPEIPVRTPPVPGM